MKKRLENLSLTLREKYPYSELSWSAFSQIRTEYGVITALYRSVFSPNAGKCGPEVLGIRTLFTQCEGNRVYDTVARYFVMVPFLKKKRDKVLNF